MGTGHVHGNIDLQPHVCPHHCIPLLLNLNDEQNNNNNNQKKTDKRIRYISWNECDDLVNSIAIKYCVIETNFGRLDCC